MKFETHNNAEIDTNMTSLAGYIQATRAQLETVFGTPKEYSADDGDGKITTYWSIKHENGTVLTVYDWKQYEAGPPGMNEVYDWHIGSKHGDRAGSVDLLHEIFRIGNGLGAGQSRAVG